MNDYLTAIFGASVQIEPCDTPSGLPLYLTSGKNFYQAKLYDIQFLIVELPEDSRRTVTALEKDLALYEKSVGGNVVFSFPQTTREQQRVLVAHRIPFIAREEQVFLPFLGVCLREHFPVKRKYGAKKMMPATQMVFLYLLYEKMAEVAKYQAAEKLGLTRTSLTRASDQLRDMGLISESRHGKEIVMIPKAFGRAYYEMGKEYLIDPVQRRVTVPASALCGDAVLAGESALSDMSMLNPPRDPVYALYKGDKAAASLQPLDERWADEALCRIELWKYPPGLFTSGDTVDVVSLSRSLKEVYDERVEGEMERVLEEYQW